jgi:glucose uptake protein GlcU
LYDFEMKKILGILALALLLVGCAASQISVVGNKISQSSFNNIALSSNNGVLGQAVANELVGRGYKVQSPGQTNTLMLRLNLNEGEVTAPKSLQAFSKEGIDAVIVVSAVGGYDQMPQSASVQIINTSTLDIMAGLNWQNGYAGQQGSIADRVMRKGLTKAAKEIVDGLTQ